MTPSRSPTSEAKEPEFLVDLSESSTKALVSEMSTFLFFFFSSGSFYFFSFV